MVKLYKEGEESLLDGDEEKAYIYYVRFFSLLETMRRTPEFSTQKEQLTSLLGGKTGFVRTMDQLENIAASLRERYQALNEPESDPEPDETYIPLELIQESPIKVPSTISPKQLYEHIKDNGFSMLIMDCRPATDFEGSKIKYEYVLNIPEEILYKGITVTKIASALKDKDVQWSSRLYKSCIVLLDQNSYEFVSDSPVWVLKDLLQNFDVNFDNKAPIYLLSGGFESFQTYYPTEVTNSHYKPVQNIVEYNPFGKTSFRDSLSRNNLCSFLDDIQYPDSVFQTSVGSLSVSGGATINLPVINRASKAVALQTYAEKEKHYQDILEKHEKVLNQSVDIGKERLRAEEDWKKINDEEEKVENIDTSRRQEVLHKIWELESKARDIEDEDEQLKEKEKDFLEKLSKAEAEKLQEQARRQEQEAKEKERKKQEYEAEQKRLALERERKLKEIQVVRQYAPKVPQTPAVKPSVKQQPFIPDRSAKPTLRTVYIPERKRDFSPVRGGMVCISSLFHLIS